MDILKGFAKGPAAFAASDVILGEGGDAKQVVVIGLLSRKKELEGVTCMFFHSLYPNLKFVCYSTFLKFPTLRPNIAID